MKRLLTYAATVAVAAIASPFVVIAACLLSAFVIFVVLAILGFLFVSFTFMLPLLATIAVIGAAAWVLFRLLD